MRQPLTLLIAFLLLGACAESSVELSDETAIITADGNPPAPGFDLEGSDPEAIAIADTVMARMGGRDAWDEARYLGWTFFNGRRHLWDKHTGQYRLESGDRVVLMDLTTQQGRAFEPAADGSLEEVTGEERTSDLMRSAYSAWVNDSYWLFMPFKLKDSGVTLTYEGERRAETSGRPSRVLGLTFDGVGVTPQNRYEVLVDDDTGLVTEWAFFRDAGDAEPGFRLPWNEYADYGGLLLSSGRGVMGGQPREISDIALYGDLPDAAFTDPAWTLE